MSFRALVFVALVPSAILHEVSHGVVALWFGDDTAKRAGRLSLNPIRHVDPFGTLLLPALLVLAGAPAFGYAKPVPVNVRRLRNPRQQALLVSLAGPAVNALLAIAAALLIRSSASFFDVGDVYGGGLAGVQRFLFALGIANVLLAAFNLIPLPPLDGSAIVERLLPARWWPRWLRFRQYSMGIVLAVVLLLPDVLGRILEPAFDLWLTLL